MLGFTLTLDPRDFLHNLAYATRAPVVIDMIVPDIVFGQSLPILNPRTQTGDQHIRRWDAMLLHQRKRTIDPSARRHAKGDALAVLPDKR